MLAEQHVQRIGRGADLLGFTLPQNWGLDYFNEWVATYAEGRSLRLRMVFYRSGTGFYRPPSDELGIIAESWPLSEKEKVVENLGLFRDYFKPCHALSNIKSGNALVYVMAARYAAQQSFDDVLILNQFGRIAEATASNVFWIKNNQVFTPPLEEGPVGGVMRAFVMSKLNELGHAVTERHLTEEELENSDACFLTNAINGIVPVASYRGRILDVVAVESIKELVK